MTAVLPEFVFCRVLWDAHHVQVPLRIVGAKMHDLHVQPEPAYPFGRKGAALNGMWDHFGTNPAVLGVLLLDGDVMIDPQDFAAMRDAIYADPAVIWAAPVRLWPVATGRVFWHWGHWRDKPSQENTGDPDCVSFSFTYLPRRAWDAAAKRGLRSWRYPLVDPGRARARPATRAECRTESAGPFR